MAKSKFEYVKSFEVTDKCLPNTWIVVRLDGRSFHKFSELHQFTKPNDDRALGLVNKCAIATMNEFQDVICSYGQSDEYSFIIKKSSTLFSRRASKILTTMVSFFTSSYVFHWSELFSDTILQYPPSFDGRIVLYPSEKNLRDYLNWRQADCHINNLYNTCFWSLVHNGMSHQEAEKKLSGTLSSDKNELLFSRFVINYNTLSAIYRKGTFLIWESFDEEIVIKHTEDIACTTGAVNLTLSDKDGSHMRRNKVVYRNRKRILILHTDIIGDQFWTQHSGILT